MSGPNHSIIASLIGTGHGAAAWTIFSSDERSYLYLVSSGSFSNRENIVGTICEFVMLWRSTSCRNCSGSNFSMITAVQPSRSVAATLAWGAEWYRGAGDKYVDAFAEAEHPLHEVHDSERLVGFLFRHRPQDSLRLPRRAGRVQHRRAEALVVDRRRRIAGNCILVAVPPLDRAVDHEEASDLGTQRRQRGRHLSFGRRRNEHLRFTVVDDVRHFFGREIGVDAREVEAGALRAAICLEHARVVLHEERDMVEPLQPEIAKQMCDPVATCLVLRERDRLTRRRHDDRRLVGMIGSVLRGVHAATLFPIRCSERRTDRATARADELARIDGEHVARRARGCPHHVVLEEVAVDERA